MLEVKTTQEGPLRDRKGERASVGERKVAGVVTMAKVCYMHI